MTIRPPVGLVLTVAFVLSPVLLIVVLVWGMVCLLVDVLATMMTGWLPGGKS